MDHDLLRIEVADDGVGVVGSAIGVGTRAMYERIAEVGGELTIEAGAGGGSVVRASLPVAKPRVAGESAAPAASLQPGPAVEGVE
jgi:signal transduction histidine kinase